MQKHRFLSQLLSPPSELPQAELPNLSDFDLSVFETDQFISLDAEPFLTESFQTESFLKEAIEEQRANHYENAPLEEKDQREKDQSQTLANLFGALAMLYRAQDHFFHAKQNTQKGIEAWVQSEEAAAGSECPVILLMNASCSSLMEGDLESAEAFAKQAVRQLHLQPSSDETTSCHDDLADGFALLGILNGLNLQWAACESHLNQALQIHNTQNNFDGVAADLMNLGEFSTRQSKTVEALQFFARAKKIIDAYQLDHLAEKLQSLESNALRLQAVQSFSPRRN